MNNRTYQQSNPFSVCFNMLKIRYADYDESISNKGVLHQEDKINVFINLESVLKYLSMITDLEKKLILERNHHIILISDTLNLAAHYKRFFINNGFDTRIYFYHTGLESDNFPQFKYNEDYRSYYLMKYNKNPKFAFLTEELKSSILPTIKTYCEFIPRVYYINAENIEGSLVPFIIANDDKRRKNFMINSDFYETQYSFLPGFVNHYFHRGQGFSKICSTLVEYVTMMLKKEKEECQSLIDCFNTYSFYCMLLSIVGDRARSIDGITGIGPRTLEKLINESLEKHLITKDVTNPTVLSNIFMDDEIKKEFISNFYQTSIVYGYEELTESEKLSVLNQRKDRYDVETLKKLNSTTFYNHPLILESLLL